MHHPVPLRDAPAAHRGFTLIELMLVLVVLGVLAVVALPSYRDSVVRSRRADGVAALAAAQQAQERWRSNATSYSANLSDLRLAASSPAGHYLIAITSASDRAYRMTATATGDQSGDAACKELVVEFSETTCEGCPGIVIGYKATGADGVDRGATEARRCWNR